VAEFLSKGFHLSAHRTLSAGRTSSLSESDSRSRFTPFFTPLDAMPFREDIWRIEEPPFAPGFLKTGCLIFPRLSLSIHLRHGHERGRNAAFQTFLSPWPPPKHHRTLLAIFSSTPCRVPWTSPPLFLSRHDLFIFPVLFPYFDPPRRGGRSPLLRSFPC